MKILHGLMMRIVIGALRRAGIRAIRARRGRELQNSGHGNIANKTLKARTDGILWTSTFRSLEVGDGCAFKRMLT